MLQTTTDQDSLISRVQADFAGHANSRNEWAWLAGRILLSNLFLALILRSGVTDAAWLSAVMSVAFVHAYSAATAVQLLRGQVTSAFTLGAVGDVTSLLGAWFALTSSNTHLFNEEETFLILFPILISIPYRYGVYVGSGIAFILVGWYGLSQMVWSADRAVTVEELPTRLLFLVSTLALATTFRYFLDQKAKELVREAEVLRRLDAAKSAFVGTVSHELRTPLTAMLAFIGRFANNRDRNLTGQQIEMVKLIERNGWHLSMLVDDLVDLSKIERDELDYNESEFDPADLISETLETVKGLANQNGHRVTVEEGRQVTVRADRNRFRQVLINLLSNAFKYSDAGTEVSVQVVATGAGLEIRIRNSGGMLSESDMERMFLLFERVENDRTRSSPGTGIGLYISRRIARDHGGDLRAESDADSTTLCLAIAADRVLPPAAGSTDLAAAA